MTYKYIIFYAITSPDQQTVIHARGVLELPHRVTPHDLLEFEEKNDEEDIGHAIVTSVHLYDKKAVG